MGRWCSFAEKKPLGEQNEPRMTGHNIVCVHTMAGYLWGTYQWWVEDGYTGTDSHFGIGGMWGSDVSGTRNLDGDIWQFQDLLYQADANLDGNPEVISIENADNANRPIKGFSDKQLDSLVRLISWLCSKEAHNECPKDWLCHQVGIPRQLIPDTKPGRRGIGYHRQGIHTSYPDRLVPGGVKWSNAVGKDCPTDIRVHQLKTIIIPRVQRLGGGGVEDDMFNEDDRRNVEVSKVALGKVKDEILPRVEEAITELKNRPEDVVDFTTTDRDDLHKVKVAMGRTERNIAAIMEHLGIEAP